MSSQLSLDPSIVTVMSSPKALDPPSASLPASLPSGSLSTGFTRIQPSKGFQSRLRLTIIQPKLLSESYESSFDPQMQRNDGSGLPPPSITEVTTIYYSILFSFFICRFFQAHHFQTKKVRVNVVLF